MLPAPDGRTYDCKYCGAQIMVSVEVEQLAAGMKLDLTNAAAFLDKLAHTLESAFADRTKVHRQGAEVHGIELDLGADVFVAKRDGRGVLAQHKKMVRGIALKTVAHPLHQWVTMLHTALTGFANENTRASQALAALFGKP